MGYLSTGYGGLRGVASSSYENTVEPPLYIYSSLPAGAIKYTAMHVSLDILASIQPLWFVYLYVVLDQHSS